MSTKTPKGLLEDFRKTFAEATEEMRGSLTPAQIKSNETAWMKPFTELGFPDTPPIKIVMLATMYQILEMYDDLSKDDFETNAWTIFLSLLDGASASE